MVAMSLKDTLLREIETLPEQRQADVLAFVRFLKIGLADPQTVERQFADALAQARAVVAKQGLTDQDIADEIQAVRAGQ